MLGRGVGCLVGGGIRGWKVEDFLLRKWYLVRWQHWGGLFRPLRKVENEGWIRVYSDTSTANECGDFGCGLHDALIRTQRLTSLSNSQIPFPYLQQPHIPHMHQSTKI